MTRDFRDEVARLAIEVSFTEVAERSLKEILGESGTSAFLYHMGGARILQDPEDLKEGIETVFGPGAETILGHILENMRSSRNTLNGGSQTIRKPRQSSLILSDQ